MDQLRSSDSYEFLEAIYMNLPKFFLAELSYLVFLWLYSYLYPNADGELISTSVLYKSGISVYLVYFCSKSFSFTIEKVKKSQENKAKLIIRPATIKDIDAIVEMTKRVYPKQSPYSKDMIRAQIAKYPIGQIVAEYNEEIAGYCSTFKVSGDIALKQHNWVEITGNGYATRHDDKGDYLYGLEVCVDPEFRNLRIGQRLYNERKRICYDDELKGIVFGGRLPGYAKRAKKFSKPEEYLEAVKNKKIRDKVASFQMRNGFEVIGVLKNYLADDKDSLGFAAHMLWENPKYPIDKESKDSKRYADSVRVGTVQYKLRKVSSFDDFKDCVEYFVDVVADYEADFVVFPELFTLQLLSLEKEKLSPAKSIEALTKYTKPFKHFMNKLAVEYNINIIGGSHPTKTENGEVQNISYVFLRDGSIHQQVKIHPTPNEKYWWNIQGGNEASMIMTDCGPIGVLICYDSEFPELARHLVNQGAQIIFVPFCTDERQAYLRVRYCSHARAVENQCYVVMSGNVGNLPRVENADIQYAQSCILTPCDFPFARDGIAADTSPNVETVAFADLSLEKLRVARNDGTVRNLKDRRFDLYDTIWKN